MTKDAAWTTSRVSIFVDAPHDSVTARAFSRWKSGSIAEPPPEARWADERVSVAHPTALEGASPRQAAHS